MFEKYENATGGSLSAYICELTLQGKADNEIATELMVRWAYLFPKVLYWDWVSIIGEYRTLQRCGDFPREYRGVRLVFDVTYVITYCDYDWCDRQYEEYSGRYKSLQAAVDAVECCINYYRNRKITTPFNPETAELFSFSAKVHESYKEKEQGS